jgi:hypothetical protein
MTNIELKKFENEIDDYCSTIPAVNCKYKCIQCILKFLNKKEILKQNKK